MLDAAHRLATVVRRDRAAAEDAVQEAALKAWRKHGQLRGGTEGFRGWFLSIVANGCRMARRNTVVARGAAGGPAGAGGAGR